MTLLHVDFSPGAVIVCVSSVGKLMVLLKCFSSQVFAARNFLSCKPRSPRSSLVLERSGVFDWRRMLDSSGAVHRRHVSCSHGHVSVHVMLGGLPVAKSVSASSSTSMDRSVEELEPDPPMQLTMQLTMAAVAEHVAVQEDIASMAAEPAGDEPGTAGDGAGDEPATADDGAGDDKPAEPCTKRRKTHMPHEAKVWFCSLARAKRGWTMAQCLRFAKKRHSHPSSSTRTATHPRKWFAWKTPGAALGRPCSLEPAAVLALADIVSRVCSRVCCAAGVLAELLNSHLETIGVAYRFSTRQSRKFMRSLGGRRTLRELCQQKIEWTMDDAAINDRSCIFNTDETCCRMLPQRMRTRRRPSQF